MGNYGGGSLLHPKIANFYKINNDTDNDGNIYKYINEDCTYNWRNLENLLFTDGEWSRTDPVYPNSYDEYLPYFRLLQPVLHHSEAALTDGNNEWLNKLQWLSNQTRMQSILQEHLHPSFVTSAVENVLFLTSILENGLGNVYHTTTKKSPPHLLRDLLDTKELRDVFGICPILFIKIIMGSPDSVNLRNIAWHGFPLPSEIPRYYTATLFIVGASLSALIEENHLELESRPQIVDFNRYVFKIRTSFIDFSLLDDISRMNEAIETSNWSCHTEHKVFWYQILVHYQSENYWQFIILILPQIELLLRRMYSETNEVDITAKLEEYYITMNTIFESKDNRLLSGRLSKGTLHLLYDIFISPYGMRIRDKISHGEVDLNCIDRNLCLILLYASMNLLTSNQCYPLDDYESRFHLNYLAYECVVASKKSVLELMTLKTPNSFELEFNWDKESIASLQELEIVKPMEIFDRHKKEPEIVTIIMKIAQLVIQVCENYQISFAERFRMLLNHELRSRTRKTLQRMVNIMTVVGVTLENIVQCLVGLGNLMQNDEHEWFEDRFSNIQRFYKQTLTIVENLVRFSDKDSNEWVNAVKWCSRFHEISTHLVISFK